MSQSVLMVKPEHPWKLTPKDLITDLLGLICNSLYCALIICSD